MVYPQTRRNQTDCGYIVWCNSVYVAARAHGVSANEVQQWLP